MESNPRHPKIGTQGVYQKNGHNKLDETTFLGRRFGEFIAESNTCYLKTKWDRLIGQKKLSIY